MSSVVDGLRILVHGGTPAVAGPADSGRIPNSKQDARARIAAMASVDVNPETGEPIPPRHDGIPSAVLGVSSY